MFIWKPVKKGAVEPRVVEITSKLTFSAAITIQEVRKELKAKANANDYIGAVL